MTQYQSQIKNHCEPLFKHFGFNYFSYGKIYENNTGIIISSNPEWIRYRLTVSNSYSLSLANNKMMYWDHVTGQESKWVAKGKQEFNYHRGFILGYERSNYCEFSEFAEPEINATRSSVTMNSEILNEFAAYFREKSVSLINKMENNYLVPFKVIKHEENSSACRQFLEQIKRNKYILLSKSGEKKVSHREYQCFKLFIKNYSAKEIAKNLSLSPRTVENYLNNIKQKLYCSSKYDLLKIAVSNGII